ncbi:MAG: hypothetical protein HFJ26_01170 [Clostridia bacterium]|nr:hypothetical protein [Clostridia bacterium]
MLSSLESEYLKGLISTYKLKGYGYYLAHTVTENNNDYDVCVYFSKSKIKAIDQNIFSIENGLKIYIDSSSRSYNTSYNTPRVVLADNNFNATISVNVAEFVYTNSILGYSEETYVLNPDIIKSGSTNYETDCFGIVVVVLICSFLLFSFLRSILRMK